MAKGFEWGQIIGPDGNPTGMLSCYPSDTVDCIVITTPPTEVEGQKGFVTLGSATDFHDGVLTKATAEINRILRNALQECDDRDKAIYILLTARGPLLAWVSAKVETRPTPEEKTKLLGL